jgi:hypothetical protein
MILSKAVAMVTLIFVAYGAYRGLCYDYLGLPRRYKAGPISIGIDMIWMGFVTTVIGWISLAILMGVGFLLYTLFQ